MEYAMTATDGSVVAELAPPVPESTYDRFQTINAILLALVTLLGAFVVWRSSVASGAAGDENVAGILATLNVEQTRAINTVILYENYRGYTQYARYLELGNNLYDALADAPDDEAADIERGMTEAWDIAETFDFPRANLNRDGTYNMERDLGEAWADAERTRDLKPCGSRQGEIYAAGGGRHRHGHRTVGVHTRGNPARPPHQNHLDDCRDCLNRGQYRRFGHHRNTLRRISALDSACKTIRSLNEQYTDPNR
jgi:hypothetical protein